MSFLIVTKQELDNFTVVIAENKLKERGRWVPPGAEEGKNLIVSVLLRIRC
jgi:hypothetical protein